MSNIGLFRDSEGNVHTGRDVTEALKRVGAQDCALLFIHTDINFGAPVPGIKRREYLDALYQAILDAGVDTIAFPAFTYSFCNGEDYDVRNSRTSMGALIEHVRKKPEARRSLDPLLSTIAIGKQSDIFDGDLGHHSLGPESAFGRLHRMEDAKFLFFGADFSEYFTYIHYIEKILDVPYRFDKAFTGKITDYAGNTYPDTHYIHTQCGGVKLRNFMNLRKDITAKGLLQETRLGDSEVTCVREKDIYREVIAALERDINSFLQEPYTEEQLTKEYTFGKNGERVTHC